MKIDKSGLIFKGYVTQVSYDGDYYILYKREVKGHHFSDFEWVEYDRYEADEFTLSLFLELVSLYEPKFEKGAYFLLTNSYQVQKLTHNHTFRSVIKMIEELEKELTLDGVRYLNELIIIEMDTYVSLTNTNGVEMDNHLISYFNIN